MVLLEKLLLLMVKVTYDSENDPYYQYEQEKYNITYYFENDPILRPLNRLLVMTGSIDEKIPQIYLNNDLGYDVTLDILHATSDSEYSGETVNDGFSVSDLFDVSFSGLTSGNTLVYTNGSWTNGLSGSVNIPQLKLDTGYYVTTGGTIPVRDELRYYWEAADTSFLNYNPEVWLFKRKTSTRSPSSVDWEMNHKKWSHEPHLNGIKFSGSSWYSGTIKCPVSEIETTGRHTEFTLSALTSSEKAVLPLDIYEWVYAQSGGTWIKLTDDVDLSTVSLKFSGRRRSMSVPLRFAIVIDNPDTTASNPKIIGELSDIVYLRYNSYDNRFIYNWNEINVKMFGNSRWLD